MKMKMKKEKGKEKKVKNSTVLTLLIFTVSFFFCLSCNDILEPPQIQTPTGAYGKIRISFAGEEAAPNMASPQTARTVLPSTTFYQYMYTFTKKGEQNGVIKAPGNDGFFALEVGSYTVAVQAFTGNAASNTLAATGVSSEFNVGPGSNNPVEVVLTGVGAGAHGEFSYTITYPTGAAAEITLHKWPGLDTIALNPVNVTQGNGKTQTLQLETGSYLLTVLVSKTGLYAGISEAIHIYPSLATAYTKNYVDNDLLSKFPGAAVSPATGTSAVTATSITINPVTAPTNGQTVEYGINTANTTPSAWQTGLTFSGLSGGVYYIFARSAENDDYAAGAASASLQMMIVTNTDQWNTALTTIRNGGSGTAGNLRSYPIMVFGNVAVPGSTATNTSFGSVQYIAVTLKGSGTLSLNSSGSGFRGSILRLGSNQTLIIDDENLALQGHSNNNIAVMYVENGTLELKNGAISGNTASSSSPSYGGGVHIANSGTFTMNNGSISGNIASTTALSISGSVTYSYGGGVYVANNGTFTMNGGTISGNTASASSSYSTSYSYPYGGGVYVANNGAFTMNGGTISGNTASATAVSSSHSYGGGVYVVSSGSFTMTGGIVYGSDAGFPLANTVANTGANVSAALYASGTAKYGDDSNILPHTDNQSLYTNNTIIPGVGGGSPESDYNISGTGIFTYDGIAKTASVTRKENAPPGAITVLYNGTETLPVNVGTYTVTFNVAAAAGFHAMTGLRAGTVTITRANGAAVSAPTGTSSVTDTSITINAVTAPSNGQTVEYARNSTNTAPSSGWQEDTTFSSLTVGTTYYIFARSKENANYNAGMASSGYQVTTPNYGISLNPSGTHTFTSTAYGYGAQSAQSVTVTNTGDQATGALTVALSGTNAGNFTLSATSINSIAAGGNDSFTVVPVTGLNAGTTAYTATVTVSGANGISTSLNVSFTVNKVAGAAVNAPTGTSTVTSTSITVNAVTAPANGQTVEYARNTTNSAPSSGWQDSTTFSDLTVGTTYYIFARSKENANYNAGMASASLQVTRVTVNFNANGGSGTTPSAQTVQTTGSSITLPGGSGLTKSGYDFGGWNTNEFGTGTNYAAGSSYTVTGTITLYARWISIEGIVSATGVELVRVPGGSFQMGSSNNNNMGVTGRSEVPIHTVTLTGFYMGKYEVTQAQYQTVMGNNPSTFLWGNNHPVETVTWYDAVEFCNKLSEREGLQPVYTISEREPSTGYPIIGATVTVNWSNSGYRLPTEAQWEYAAKGGNGSPGNYTYAGSNNPDEVAWYDYNGDPDGAKVVGTKAPNGLGLYDMSGNVHEWCWDVYEDYSSGAQTDPTGASSSWGSRVQRGGAWHGFAVYVRSASRSSSDVSYRSHSIGFRLARP
jgi:uncharacterized repeat protein (TIGR02543 family)